ncbi:MAG: cupin [Candidatus Woykebacteria bacterium GWB1_45_5]|uniref:Cupin n=1 Tax=Candidatus Woykebacteria bacterium GWB1_45_5 TaxID=1802592 RepID=A0A1G1W4X0_9BACT|nr:MAG: cupin [Candidatus Woykebacteria bacterium GWB1_45_5]
MKGLIKGVAGKARENTDFRQVLETGANTQIVIMSIPPGGEIGEEVHDKEDQVLYFVAGSGEAILEGAAQPIEEGDIVLVHKGTKHNFKNTGLEDLKIITTYSPPHHPSGTIHKTKEEADNAGY